MRGESYTLHEVAELLGVSKRTLQRRIREGAFPGRFLSPGPHGLETRIPAADVRVALEDARGASELPGEGRSLVMRGETRPTTPSAIGLAASDLEAVRDAVLAITRADRDVLLAALKDAVASRDRDLVAVQNQLSSLQGAVERMRRRIDGWMERQDALAAQSAVADDAPVAVDLGRALIEDIDQMLSQLVNRH